MNKFLLLCALCALVLLAACGGSSNANKPSNPNASATPALAPTESSTAVSNSPTATVVPTNVPVVQPTSVGAANPPLVPQLQLTAESKDTVVVLTWTGDNAKGYFVYRNGNANPLTSKPITTTTYQDIGLTNGRTYTYTVASVSADGTIGVTSAPITAVPKSQ